MAKHPIRRRLNPLISAFKRQPSQFGILKNKPKTVFSWVIKHKVWSAVFIVVFAVAVFFLWPKAAKPISTETVKKELFIQSLSMTGVISAERSANLSFLTGGKLVFLGAKKGDYVNAYQTVAVLDQRTAQESLAQALIDYSKQRNSFDQVKEDNLNRTPQQALTDKMRRLLENNQYDLEKSVNSVELQSLAKEQSILLAPFAGILTRSDVVSTGVNVSTATIWTLTDPDSLTFKMEVDEADISKVKNGQTVNVVLNSYPDKTFHLIVDSIDFITHTTTTGGNAFDVKAKISSNDDYIFRAGMNGNAEIIVEQKKGAIGIPLSSLIGENKVYLKTKDGFKKRKVKLGIQNDSSVVVLSGLGQGDVIATDPTLVSSKK